MTRSRSRPKAKTSPRTCPDGYNLDPRTALWIFVVALVLRIAHVLCMRQSPYFDHPLVDAFTFHEAALAIASGGGHPDKIFWQPPGYPYFLGMVYGLVGGADFLIPRLFQAFLGSIAAVLTAWIGARQFGRTVGVTAGVIVALYGTLIYFDAELLGVSLTVLLQLAAVALSLVAWGHARPTWIWLAAGIAGGLASLVTATSLVLLGPLAFFARRHAPWLLLGALLAIAPATIRNAVRGGELVPISWNGGVNLYIGNNPRYDDVVGIRPTVQWKDLTAEPVRHGIWTKNGASSYFVRKVTDWAVREPMAFVKLQIRKVGLFLRGDEIFRNQAIYPSRSYSPVLAVLLWKVPWLAFPFGVLAPLGILGLALAWKRAPLLAWIIVVYAIANLAFFITARYRAPLVPYLAIFAASGVYWLAREATSRSRAIAIAVLIGLFVLSNMGAGTMPARMNADAELTLAAFFHREGKLDQARVHYMTAAVDRPDDSEVWAFLGALEMDAGNLPAAEQDFERALRIRPDEQKAVLGLAVLRDQQGRPSEALALYRRALTLDPKDVWSRGRIQELERGLRGTAR